MVPKNIAIAGPERTAALLVPSFLVFTRVMSPVINTFNWMANSTLRLLGVDPRDELEAAFTSGELAEMISDSRREGLLDDEETSRLERTLSSAQATVADVVVSLDELVTLSAQPTVGEVAAAVEQTGFSRFPLRADGRLIGYLHVKDILDVVDDPAATVPASRFRGLPEIPADARLDEALAALRTSRAHLARAVDAGGDTVGLIAMEDLLEAYVGTVRDSTHTPHSED
jgi:CBS domain containing-hemolysin-like protein